MSPGGLAGHSAALIGYEAVAVMSRDAACVSFLGHAEIEGSEPSPGTSQDLYIRIEPRITAIRWGYIRVSDYSFQPRFGCLDCTDPTISTIESPGKRARAVRVETSADDIDTVTKVI